MSVSNNEILRVGRLARLTIEGSELPRLTADCSGILEYVKKLEEVDVSEVEPMSHVHGISNILREDNAACSVPGADLMAAVPEAQDGFIVVPLVIEQE